MSEENGNAVGTTPVSVPALGKTLASVGAENKMLVTIGQRSRTMPDGTKAEATPVTHKVYAPTLDEACEAIVDATSPIHDYMLASLERGFRGNISNDLNVSEYAPMLASLDGLLQVQKLKADRSGNRGAALAERREMLAAFAAYLKAAGVNERGISVAKNTLASGQNIETATPKRRDAVAARLLAFSETEAGKVHASQVERLATLLLDASDGEEEDNL